MDVRSLPFVCRRPPDQNTRSDLRGCPLSGVKRIWSRHTVMSVNDPMRVVAFNTHEG